MSPIKLFQEQDYWKGSFSAMASPCDVLMDVNDKKLAQEILKTVANEAWRIEKKYSRYQKNNIIYQINHAQGQSISLDKETTRLFDFANELFNLSEGLFDVSSGVLRQVWYFDGSDKLPEKEAVKKILNKVGWQKIQFKNQKIKLPIGMEVDLGGIGKEYAVDSCVLLAKKLCSDSVLVNFGGDLAMSSARKDKRCWSVGRMVTGQDDISGVFQLFRGALATSGDKNRYLLKNGVRYSHILNPKTGWAVCDAPHTVSVASATCIEAGMLSTLAMLHGAQAEEFLKLQAVNYWLA